MEKKYKIIGMTCSACASSVEKAVTKVEGVNKVNVNLLSNSMTVSFDNSINDNDIIAIVKDAGFGAETFDKIEKNDNNEKDTTDNELSEMKKRIIVSFAFLIPLMYISMGHMLKFPLPTFLKGYHGAMNFAFLQLLLALPIVYVNRKYYQIGFKTLFKRHPNMDSLIAIGSSAALAYGVFAIFKIGEGLAYSNIDMVNRYSMDLYFESAAMILALITLGKYLEARSKGRTGEAIGKLLNLAPKTAIVLRNDEEIEISLEEVVVGDIVAVKPGQSIPVDGIIISGNSAIDESAITGESIPIEKTIGDKVIGATTNKTGYFTFEVTKVGSDTTLSQIIKLVEEAGSSKAPIAKLADNISSVFVPIVISIAILATIVWLILGNGFEFALSIGIAVLVISCPCALGLATPVAIMVATGKGASNGILIKSAEALQIAHKIDTVVLDKTGTITEGKPKVTDIITYGKMTEKELLSIAATIEKPSEHPLADAVLTKAKEENIVLQSIENFNSITGKGIECSIEGKRYFAGNLLLLKENNIETTNIMKDYEKFAIDGKTPLIFADDKKVIGIISVMDTIKENSKKAVELFKAMHITVAMLTGDNKRTAEAIKRQLELDEVVAEVLPQDKESYIRKLQESGRKVAMIGDGINDAPALMRADVGIAIGAGTDVAIESADIVLMKSDLLDGVASLELSKATFKNIKQNLFWAFFYNVLGIPLAAGVFYSLLSWKLNPMFAAAAMSMSSLFVVSNALRLRLFKSKYEKQRIKK